MKADRWRQIRQIFERAVELPPKERGAFLKDASGGDEELIREVEELIAHEAQAPANFATPPPERIAVPSARTLPEGLVLGGFTLLESIGRGANGVVYRARQESLGRDVAIKVFLPNLLTSETEVARFRQEVHAASRMEHPAIARVLEHGHHGELLWYAMELVPGHGLDEELRRQRELSLGVGPRPLLNRPGYPDHASTVAELIAEIADALAHAHRAGVIHRDVKPSNLVLTPEGRLKLVDFGIAKTTALGQVNPRSPLTGPDELIGSIPYMSPEQARVLRGLVDQRTDIYSLGVVLYELLTLRRPFDGSTTAELLTQLRSTDPRPVRRLNPKTPTDLAVICGRAMAKVPNDRYQSAVAFRDDLRRFLRHEAIEARAPSPWRRLRRMLHRRRLWWIPGTAAVLAAFFGWQLRKSTIPERRPARVSIAGPERARAAWRPMELLTGLPGIPIPLGELPVREVSLPAGPGRFEVEGKGIRRGFARDLHEDSLLELVVEPLRSVDTVRDRMVRIGGGLLQVEGPDVSPLAGKQVEVGAFWIDRTEVSIGEYRQFLAANPERAAPFALVHVPADGRFEDRPLVGVSFVDALAYAEWCGKRLPTQAEWLFAARGPELRRFPWGSDDGVYRGASRGPYWQAGGHSEAVAQFLAHTLPVDVPEGDVTPEGVWHMLGNVYEWTETPFRDVWLMPPRLDPGRRIVCGAAFDAQVRSLDLTQIGHFGVTDADRYWLRGFRCAADE